MPLQVLPNFADGLSNDCMFDHIQQYNDTNDHDIITTDQTNAGIALFSEIVILLTSAHLGRIKT